MTRLNRRLLLGAIAVLVPVLAGCEAGLNAPTLEFHPASNGVSITQNGITLDNVFVLGPPLGSALPPGGRAGVFLSIEAENGDRLISVSAPGTASAVKLTGGPVDLPAQTLVDLSGPEPKMVLTRLANPLFGGQTVQLTLIFHRRERSRSPCRSSRTPTNTRPTPRRPSPSRQSNPRRTRPARRRPVASGSASVGASASGSPPAHPPPRRPRRSRTGPHAPGPFGRKDFFSPNGPACLPLSVYFLGG